MFTIGLTGGIGSGKSTASDFFKMLGAAVIDADTIARNVVEPHSFALAEIKNHFGSAFIQANGTLNRSKLREVIFSHPKEKIWLEELLHPPIRQNIINQINAAQTPYCLLVSPLLLETDQRELVDRIIVIDVTEDTQIARSAKRDNNSVEQIKAIMQTQQSRLKRLQLADDIIINENEISCLEKSVALLHNHYMKLSNE